jgi:hypothetical protein
MVGRRTTPSECRWPDTPEFGAIAQQWNEHAITLLLGYVWKGYDRLAVADLPLISWDAALDDVERDISQILEPYIHEEMTGIEPFFVQHGSFERESRQPSPAQPLQYDIAFVLWANRRIMWPLEAKLIHTDKELARYIADIREQFLTCRYAPFSSGGAMLGYFLGGSADVFFAGIAGELVCSLCGHPNFPERLHRVSTHVRRVPRGKAYPKEFSCHHMVMPLRMRAPRGARRRPG